MVDVIIKKATDEQKRKSQNWSTWECEPKEFDYSYSDVETCYIIEGSAEISYQRKKFIFNTGDWVIFPKGLNCKWNISKKIVKKYKFG